MRFLIWFSVPVLILCFAILVTMVLNWSQGLPYCSTWLRAALPFCN